MTTLTIAAGVAALFFMCAFIAVGVMLVCATKELTRVVQKMNQDEPKPNVGKVKFVGPGSEKPKSKPHGGRFGNRRNPPRKWRGDKP